MVAVKKSYTKVVFREIRQSISRFLAIFAISALGVGFLAGLLATTPDMRISADRYYDETNLMDIRVLSTVGLAEEDIAVIRNTAGVADVMPAYSADALLVSEGDSTLLTRIHSLPFGGEEEAYLNRVELIEGRLPEKAGECVVKEAVMGGNPVSIGDTVRLSPDNADLSGTLAVDSFTVVGVVTSAYYMSIERETSNIGDGQVDLIAYTVEDSFCLEVYTDAFVTVKEAKEKQTFTEAYKNTVQPVADALETLGETQVMVRYDKVMAEANEKLDDARKQYEEGKAESDRRLQEAAAELEDAGGRSPTGKESWRRAASRSSMESGVWRRAARPMSRAWRTTTPAGRLGGTGCSSFPTRRTIIASRCRKANGRYMRASRSLRPPRNNWTARKPSWTATRPCWMPLKARFSKALTAGSSPRSRRIRRWRSCSP